MDILKLKEALMEVRSICNFYSRKYGDCMFKVTTYVYPKDWELDELGK